MFRQITRTAIIVSSLAALSLVAVGCHGHRGKMEPDKAYKFLSFGVDDTLDELDATAPQRTEVHAVKDKLFDKGIAFRDVSKDHRKALVSQWATDEPDAKVMHDEIDRWAEEMRTLAHDMVDASLELHGTLSPSQRVELMMIIVQRAGE